jgi:hypothetical protein
VYIRVQSQQSDQHRHHDVDPLHPRFSPFFFVDVDGRVEEYLVTFFGGASPTWAVRLLDLIGRISVVAPVVLCEAPDWTVARCDTLLITC